MTYTLGELLFDVYSALGQITTFKASGGSTTTAVKTGTGYTQTNLTGALIVRETTDGLAPQHEFEEVTSFAPSTGTFTVGTALSATIGAGDLFGYASPLYPLQQVIENINEGLRWLGDLYLVDTTTLDSASNQTEYAASLTWKRRPPVQIDIQGNTSDSNDNRWVTENNWYYVPAAPGSTGLIVFNEQPVPSRDLRIWYQDKHPRVNTYADNIAEVIAPELAVAVCAEKALLWQVNRTQGSEKSIVSAHSQAMENRDRAIGEHPIWKPKTSGKIFHGHGTSYVPDAGEPNKVRL